MLHLDRIAVCLLLLCSSSSAQSDFCPEVPECKCYISVEDNIADCINTNLEFIPYLPENLTELHVIDSLLTVVERDNLTHLTDLRILDLEGNLISNIEADALDGLVRLVEVDLHNNQIKNLHADIFSGSQLEILQLKSNNFTEIPMDVLEGLNTLEYLDISDNHITQINRQFPSSMTSLVSLFLNDNFIVTINSNVFATLSNVEVIYLERNRISDLQLGAFSGLSKLHALYLSHNEIPSMEDITLPTSLDILSLSHNKLDEVPSNAINTLTNLKTLHLSENYIERISTGDFGSGLSGLEMLYLDDIHLTLIEDKAFDELVSLKIITINNNPNLTEVRFGHLEKQEAINYIHLRGNGLLYLLAGMFTQKTGLLDVDITRNPFDCQEYSREVQWMSSAREEGYSWASQWIGSGSPRCARPAHLVLIPEIRARMTDMLEGDFNNGDPPTIEPLSPTTVVVNQTETATLQAALRVGIPISWWVTPDGAVINVPRFPDEEHPDGRSKTTENGDSPKNDQDRLEPKETPQKDLEKNEHVMITTLYIKDANFSDAGNYQLIAGNSIENTTTSFTLDVVEMPEPIEGRGTHVITQIPGSGLFAIITLWLLWYI